MATVIGESRGEWLDVKAVTPGHELRGRMTRRLIWKKHRTYGVDAERPTSQHREMLKNVLYDSNCI